MNLESLKVGDKVSIAKGTTYGIKSLGPIGTVTKKDKVKIVVNNGIGGEFIFSAKFGQEKDWNGKYTYRSNFLETIETREKREATEQYRLDVRKAWEDLNNAVINKDIPKIEEYLNLVKSLQS